MAKIVIVRGGPRRVRPKKYAKPAGSVAYTLSAAPASYTLTVQSAGFQTARKLPASPASFIDTASTASPSAGWKFSAAGASFTDTASSAAVAAQRKLAAAPASFVDTASNATLTFVGATAYSLTASPASFSLTAIPAAMAGPQTILLDTHDWVEPWSHKRRRKKREEEERLEAQRLTDRKPIVTGTATPALKVALKDKPKPIEQEWKPDPRPLQLDISAFLTKMQAVDRLDEQERRRMIEEDDLRMIAAFLQHLDA